MSYILPPELAIAEPERACQEKPFHNTACKLSLKRHLKQLETAKICQGLQTARDCFTSNFVCFVFILLLSNLCLILLVNATLKCQVENY